MGGPGGPIDQNLGLVMHWQREAVCLRHGHTGASFHLNPQLFATVLDENGQKAFSFRGLRLP